MAKKVESKVPETIDSVEALQTKIAGNERGAEGICDLYSGAG